MNPFIKKTSKQEKKMTGKKPPAGAAAAPAFPKVKSMMGKKPFVLQPKKPEPDDRPRPARPPSTNKNMAKSKAARNKRLAGVAL